MKKKRFPEEEIIAVLKEGDSGIATPELCCKRDIIAGTYYRWKSKYGGTEISDAKRLRTLEEGNCRLRKAEISFCMAKNNRWALTTATDPSFLQLAFTCQARPMAV